MPKLPTRRRKFVGVNPKGLRRCCLITLRDYDGPQEEGTAIQCSGCLRHLALIRGQWVDPDQLPSR